MVDVSLTRLFIIYDLVIPTFAHTHRQMDGKVIKNASNQRINCNFYHEFLFVFLVVLFLFHLFIKLVLRCVKLFVELGGAALKRVGLWSVLITILSTVLFLIECWLLFLGSEVLPDFIVDFLSRFECMRTLSLVVLQTFRFVWKDGIGFTDFFETRVGTLIGVRMKLFSQLEIFLFDFILTCCFWYL